LALMALEVNAEPETFTVSVETGRKTWIGAAFRSLAKVDMLSFSYENRMERVRSVKVKRPEGR